MKTSLERVQLKDTIKVVMPKTVLHKIQYLCRAIARTEWSGVLLYTVTGSIKRPKSVKIILKDIIPMQKGSAAYTEYSFNEKKRDTSGHEDRMIDYFNANPKVLEENWRVGHIHSHNVMEVFFSGTDMEELEENSASHDFYLSLIVNNWMDFKAKIAFRGTIDTEVPVAYEALDETGKPYTLSKSQLKVKKEKVFIYDCDIKAPIEKELSLDETFCNNVTEIIEKAKVEEEERKKASQLRINQYGTSYHLGHPNYHIPGSNPWGIGGQTDTRQSINPLVSTSPNKVTEKPTDIARDIVKDIPYNDLNEDDTDLDEPESDVMDFTVALLKNSYPVEVETDSLTEILDVLDIMSKDFKAEDLAKNILTNYPALFEKHFENTADEPKVFIEVSDEVIDLLGDYEAIYDFLTPTIEALKVMVDKYEEYVSTI